MEEQKAFHSPEEEIQYLEQKILEKKRELAGSESREAVKNIIDQHIDAVALPAVPAPLPLPQVSAKPDTDTDEHVALYIQHAFQHGIAEAVREVRNSHNPYLIDAFHDALADRFLDALRAKGLLETNG